MILFNNLDRDNCINKLAPGNNWLFKNTTIKIAMESESAKFTYYYKHVNFIDRPNILLLLVKWPKL